MTQVILLEINSCSQEIPAPGQSWRKGVIGAVKRSNFLMSRKKIIKVHFQKNFDEGSEDENPFAFGKSTKKEY